MPTFSASGASASQTQRFDGFELAEEKATRLKLLRVWPVFEQPFRDSGDAWIAGLAPCSDAGSDLIDQRNLDKDARIIECPRTFGCDDVTCFPALALN